MELLHKNVYFGPNSFLDRGVVYLLMDLGSLQDVSLDLLGPAFLTRLFAVVPGLTPPGSGQEKIKGIAQQVFSEKGLGLARLIEVLALQLQRDSGQFVDFGETRPAGLTGQYRIFYAYDTPEVGLKAGDLAIRLLASLLPEPLRNDDFVAGDFDAHGEIQNLTDRAAEWTRGITGYAIQCAARRRGIPVTALDRWPAVAEGERPHPDMVGVLLLGQGINARFIKGLQTQVLSREVTRVLNDRRKLNQHLAALNVPVPTQDTEFSGPDSVHRVLQKARRIGFPVVLRPVMPAAGREVFPGIGDIAQLASACARIARYSRSLIVEKHVPGQTYRLLMINEALVAASRRMTAQVTGDGIHTLHMLIEAANAHANANSSAGCAQDRIVADSGVVAQLDDQGWSLDRIVPLRQTVQIAGSDRPARGGVIEDVTAEVDREVIAAAAAAARAFDLRVAGIDLVTADISRPLSLTGGAIIGVDAAPELDFHCLPGECLPLAAAARYLNVLLPPGTRSHVPIAAVTGTNGKTTTCRMVTHILRYAGRHVGLACTDGVYIDGRMRRKGVSSGVSGALTVFSDPGVDTAVLETSRGTLVQKGLAFDECTVSACTNVANDHLGLDGINTVDEMAALKRVIVEKAREMAVLNADDERCLQMIPYLKAQRICLVSVNSRNIAVKEHIKKGGAAVVTGHAFGKQRINVYNGFVSTPLLYVDEIPATWGGVASFNVENAMFAAGIAMGMGAALDTISEALRNFTASIDLTPGRLNVYDKLPFRVIIDYAHNVHGLKSLCGLVSQVKVTGRRILVMFSLGDRSDDNIAASATTVSGHFDHFICRDSNDLRGRDPGEVPRLLNSGLIREGISPEHIEIIPDYDEAVAKALTRARAGDLLVILARRQYERTMAMLDNFQRSGQ